MANPNLSYGGVGGGGAGGGGGNITYMHTTHNSSIITMALSVCHVSNLCHF